MNPASTQFRFHYLKNIRSGRTCIIHAWAITPLSSHPAKCCACTLLRHRFHASFVECRAKHELWLVTQLMAKGSCLHAMTAATKQLGMAPGMHEDWLVWVLREALQGLKYFHEHQQIQ